MGMKFHHLGVATESIDLSRKFIHKNFEVLKESQTVYDRKQDATLQMIETPDINIELISGNIVLKLIEKKITFYHICYEVDCVYKAIENFKDAIVISWPKEAVLFDNRMVAFLMTPLGLIELLNAN